MSMLIFSQAWSATVAFSLMYRESFVHGIAMLGASCAGQVSERSSSSSEIYHMDYDA